MNNLSTYLRGSLAGALGKGSTLIGGYAGLWLLTQILSKSGYGSYVTAFTIVSLLAAVAQIGLRQSTIQRVSEFSATKTDDSVYQYAGAAVSWVLLTSGLFAVALWLSAPLLGTVFQDGDIELWGRLLAFVIPAFAVRPICGGVLRGIERVPTAVALEEISRQVIRTGGLVLCLLFAPSPLAVTIAVAAGTYLPLAAFAVMSRGWRFLNLSAISRSHLEFSFFLLLNSLTSRLMSKTDILVLAALGSATATGAYNVAWKIAIVSRFGDKILTSVQQPRISKFLETGEPDKLVDEYDRVRDFTVVFALGIFMLLLVGGRQLLGVFGSYTGQYAVVLALSLGIVLNGTFGSIGQILIMGKQGRLVLLNSVGSLAANVILNVILIPIYGTLGAAAATIVTVFGLTNAVGIVQVKYLYDIDLLDRRLISSVIGLFGAYILYLMDIPEIRPVLFVGSAIIAVTILYRQRTVLRALLNDIGLFGLPR